MKKSATDQTEWVAVDWGTSNLRAWVMGAGGKVLHRLSSEQGLGSLRPEEFEDALLALIGAYIPDDKITPVVASGMVGARQGWIEAPYASAPCAPPSGVNAILAPASDPRIAVRIVPGVMQSKPSDVMRGEETQIAGYLAERPDFDGVVCLPGTHSKWVHISAGEIVSFQTFMTGELFALLSEDSVLRHSVQSDDFDGDAFNQAVADALSKPASFASRLFAIRAGSLISDLGPSKARATLSGLLIGMELAGSRPYWLGREVAIVGAPTLSKLYHRALSEQGLIAILLNAENLTLAGLTAAHRNLKGS